MKDPLLRFASRAFALPTLALSLLATPAFAHTSDRGFVLLLPTGYYLAGGAMAVAASFVALVALPKDAFERVARLRLLLPALPEPLRLVTSLAAFLCMIAFIAAGVIGSRDPLSNPLPLTVWTLLWIGLPLIQGTLGDLWWWINPWHAPARMLASAGVPTRRMPEWLGYWPAFLLFGGFAWFELIDPAPDDPLRLAIVVSIYFVANLFFMTVFGVEAWSRRGECLSAFFHMVSRFAIVGRDGAAMPGARLAATAALPLSGALFVLLALSTVSFDGFSKTFTWLGANTINPLEFPGRTALMAINSFGLGAAFFFLAGAFMLAVLLGDRMAGQSRSIAGPAGVLVWSLVPIALAYHFSHYLTALLVNGQYALVALSDPFSMGWNLFGTADNQVSAGIVMGSESVFVLWNLQAGAIIAGHVLAVLIAHVQAARLHRSRRAAALSQLPLAALMIAYTVFGLWLLSTPTAA